MLEMLEWNELQILEVISSKVIPRVYTSSLYLLLSLLSSCLAADSIYCGERYASSLWTRCFE